MEGAETERRMHIVWFYVHEKQNMQRDSITSNATTVGKSGGHTSDDKLQRMGCWKVETSNPRSDV